MEAEVMLLMYSVDLL